MVYNHDGQNLGPKMKNYWPKTKSIKFLLAGWSFLKYDRSPYPGSKKVGVQKYILSTSEPADHNREMIFWASWSLSCWAHVICICKQCNPGWTSPAGTVWYWSTMCARQVFFLFHTLLLPQIQILKWNQIGQVNFVNSAVLYSITSL